MRRSLGSFVVLALIAAVPRPAGAIFASPVQAGCYIAAQNDCRVHVDPFTINIASGKKLALFDLVLIQIGGTGAQTVIYDWRPDQSNPAPASGTTYSPTVPSQDLGVSCGSSYELSLQGRDTGDSSTFNLGLTGTFTCPSGLP
jgi:hypothetical protein